MLERVRRDLQRYFVFESRTGEPGLAEKLKIVAASQGLKALLVHRLGAWLCRTQPSPVVRIPLKIVHRGLYEAVKALWGMEIHSDADIEGGLYIAHPYGILIGPAKMGRDCNVSAHVTIGLRPGGMTSESAPTVGERVFFGPGAIVYGAINIASGTAVGPLTVVGRNLPPNCFVVGNPMQIVRKNYDNNTLIYGTRPPPAE
jgi:serine O-acetyltransferase